MDCDDGGVGCVSGAAQPASIVKANPAAEFARSLSNLPGRFLRFSDVEYRIQQNIAPGGQVLGFGVFDLATRTAYSASWR